MISMVWICYVYDFFYFLALLYKVIQVPPHTETSHDCISSLEVPSAYSKNEKYWEQIWYEALVLHFVFFTESLYLSFFTVPKVNNKIIQRPYWKLLVTHFVGAKVNKILGIGHNVYIIFDSVD